MANLQRILGTMLASGLGGRSARGGVFASGTRTPMRASRGGMNQTAGLASLGHLAYQAYQQMKAQNPAAQNAPTVNLQGRSAHGDGPSLGDRMAEQLARGPAPDDPAMRIGDDKALLLVRAMVAAANADGRIDEGERGRILSMLDQSGATEEERQILERELADPPSLEDVVAHARAGGGELAEQVWLASHLAIRPDSPADHDYLDRLAAHLNLNQSRQEELRQIA